MSFFKIGFQEPSSITLEGILSFNRHLLIVILLIIIITSWSLYSIVNTYYNLYNCTERRFTHSKEIEVLWTLTPIIILIILAVPSFTILYSLDEIVAPDMTLKIIAHQWFWCYEIDDFLRINLCGDYNSVKRVLRYSSYLLIIDGVPKKRISEGYFRLLETTKRVLLPIKTFLRLLVSSSDVLHSWGVPSFGIKTDACPGRLNQINLFIEKMGLYFGACYEICGVQHGFMPISVVATFKENLIEKITILKK